MLHHQGPERTIAHNQQLAVVLGFVAGAVNATGFLVVGEYTSHVTGNVARVGGALASGNFPLAWHAGFLVLCFLLGAMTSALLTESPLRLGRTRFAAAVATEGLVLALFTVARLAWPGVPLTLLAGGLCYAMGIQNALVTRVSDAVVRTTHLTGVITDIGIELVALVSRTAAHAAPDDEVRSEAAERLRLHGALVLAFLFGGTVVPLLYLHVGPAVMAGPSALLTGLAALEIRRAVTTGPPS